MDKPLSFPALKTAEFRKLRKILKQHDVASITQQAISQWAAELLTAAFHSGASSVMQALDKHHQDQRDRFDRLSQTGILPTVKVLRAGMNAIDGGPSGNMWGTAKSDELMRAADSVILSTDAVKRAKLITACQHEARR